jgi:hypothetical protein
MNAATKKLKIIFALILTAIIIAVVITLFPAPADKCANQPSIECNIFLLDDPNTRHNDVSCDYQGLWPVNSSISYKGERFTALFQNRVGSSVSSGYTDGRPMNVTVREAISGEACKLLVPLKIAAPGGSLNLTASCPKKSSNEAYEIEVSITYYFHEAMRERLETARIKGFAGCKNE